MSSSTSSSERRTSATDGRFLLLVVLGLAVVNLAVGLLPIWTATDTRFMGHIRAAERFGADAEFALVGDSKTGRFSHGFVSPYLSHKGVVFTSDSVTAVYQFLVLQQAYEANPAFRPKNVFLAIGANNFNLHGLHDRRDFALFMLAPMGDVLRFAPLPEELLLVAEVVFSRLLPVYGRRIQITHLNATLDREAEVARDVAPSWESFAGTSVDQLPVIERSEIRDRNYLAIYARSVLDRYEFSHVHARALAAAIEEVRSHGGTPWLVLLPVTEDMAALEHELVGTRFDDAIEAFAAEQGVEILDHRDLPDLGFEDVNHLNWQGAHEFARRVFEPILAR